MVNYVEGKIYKLVCDETNTTYYGSTCNMLAKRLNGHKKISNCAISKIMINPKIFLVEKYPCDSKIELNARERWWIENNECINKNIPCRPHKEWYEANKEKILQKSKEWYQKKKEKISQQRKEWYEANKEEVSQQRKEWYQKNKERIGEKITCECGCKIHRGCIARHRGTKKHEELMKSIN